MGGAQPVPEEQPVVVVVVALIPHEIRENTGALAPPRQSAEALASDSTRKAARGSTHFLQKQQPA